MRRYDIAAAIDKGLEWSAYLAIFALPFSKSVIEICAACGLVLLVAKKAVARRFSIPATPANIPLLLIALTSVISLVNSQYMILSARAIFAKTGKFILLYFLVVEAIDTREKLMNLLKITFASAVVIFIDTLMQYFVTHIDLLHNYPAFKYVYCYTIDTSKKTGGFLNYFIGYPTGSFPFPNDLSAWLLIIMPPAVFLSLMDLKGRRERYLVLLFSLVGLYIFVLAKARGAWIGFIAAVTATLAVAQKRLLIVLAAVLVMIALCFVRSPNDIFGFTSMRDRSDMWRTGAKIFMRHPVIGNGLNTFFNEFKEMRDDEWKGKKGSYAHNCYLQMAADTGLVGLGSFLAFVAALMLAALRFLRSEKRQFYYAVVLGLLTGMAGFLLHSLVDTNLYSLNLASLFWMAAGLLVSVMKIAGLENP